MSEEMAPQTPQQSSQHPSKPRINLQELRNSELVSRYLAATPPYLYSAPVGPHNFFFSEMLRSLVQARNNSDQSVRNQVNQINPSLPGRRPRKRAWSNHRSIYEPTRETSSMEKPTSEKPLELTNKTSFPATKYQKCESPKILTPENSIKNLSKIDLQDTKHIPPVEYPSNMSLNSTSNRIGGPTIEPAPAAVPPSELVLPPPPPMWYPPLYPPYGIDPLHFFIDLRVSGHIYDRKKENISPTNQTSDNNNITPSIDGESINKYRHGSAFSVPQPRRDKSPLALNLSSGSPKKSEFNHTFEHGNESVKNTNYVLQNLPRIYTHLAGHGGEERNSLNSEETDCKSECDIQEVDGRDDRSDGNDDEMDDVVIVDNKSNKSESY